MKCNNYFYCNNYYYYFDNYFRLKPYFEQITGQEGELNKSTCETTVALTDAGNKREIIKNIM